MTFTTQPNSLATHLTHVGFVDFGNGLEFLRWVHFAETKYFPQISPLSVMTTSSHNISVLGRKEQDFAYVWGLIECSFESPIRVQLVVSISGILTFSSGLPRQYLTFGYSGYAVSWHLVMVCSSSERLPLQEQNSFTKISSQTVMATSNNHYLD